jgi:hypothetical protein
MQGEPCLFLPGHHNRKTLRYIEMAMGYETPCWRSQLHLNRNGYGRCWDGKGRMSLAHRVQWELVHGPIPDGLEVHHLCGQRDCINTSHLEVMSRREHLRRAGKTVLTDDQVRAIRRADGPQRLVAREHGTCQSNISRIRRGQSRRDVVEPPWQKPPSSKRRLRLLTP